MALSEIVRGESESSTKSSRTKSAKDKKSKEKRSGKHQSSEERLLPQFMTTDEVCIYILILYYVTSDWSKTVGYIAT